MILKHKVACAWGFIALFIIVVYFFNHQYGAYLFRWQMSTPTMALFLGPLIAWFTEKPIRHSSKKEWAATGIVNLIGGLLFYFWDKFLIFN